MEKRLVIKIGSDVLTSGKDLNHRRINSLAEDISELYSLGYEVLIVSSGAISSGMKKLNLNNKPDSMVEKRALSAIGQCYLMGAWIKAFDPILVAQALLTWKELADDESKLKARETILKIIEKGIIPVINENDAIADDEIKFSDNDQLALMLAKLVHANQLILLTDVDGLYSKDPKHNKDARLISQIKKIDNKIKSMAGESGSDNGLGGMLSKIIVAEEAMKHGIQTNILNGKKIGLIISLVRYGTNKGTEFKKD